MTTWLILTAVVVALCAATLARADDYSDCAQQNHPDLSVRACTNIIATNTATREQLAVVYYDRGTAYANRGSYDVDKVVTLVPGAVVVPLEALEGDRDHDYDRAIADYDKAIQLKPDYAWAYYGRSHAYGMKNDHDHASADYKKALLLAPPLPRQRPERPARDPTSPTISLPR